MKVEPPPDGDPVDLSATTPMAEDVEPTTTALEMLAKQREAMAAAEAAGKARQEAKFGTKQTVPHAHVDTATNEPIGGGHLGNSYRWVIAGGQAFELHGISEALAHRINAAFISEQVPFSRYQQVAQWVEE